MVMTKPFERLQELIDLAYAAALDPTGWDRLLSALCATLESKSAALVTYVFSTGAAQLHAAVGADPALLPLYEHYSPKNPFMPTVAHLAHAGFIGHSLEHVPDATLRKTEYFNEYMRRADYHHNLALCLAREGASATMIYPVRAIGRPQFSAADLRLCRALMPHLQRALAIHRRLAEAGVLHTAATAALDQLTLGVFVLDRHGHVVFANGSGRAMGAANDGVTIERDGLGASRASDGAKLRRAIAQASGGSEPGSTRTGHALRIGRPSLRRDLEVFVVPVEAEASVLLDLRQPAAVVFVADPERKVDAWDAVLARLYGLTPAEAKNAILLLQGYRVQDIADELAVDVNTTRTHLKRIFSKTGARTQSDFIRLLLYGPAQLRHGVASH
jgi:DNA-binding CsgD family transcriptional regulator